MMDEITYIKPKRSNIPTFTARWQGRLYNAPMSWFSERTGKSVACMLERKRQVDSNHRNYTNEQILGIDDIRYDPAENLPRVNKKQSLLELHKQKTDPMSEFLRRRLVA